MKPLFDPWVQDLHPILFYSQEFDEVTLCILGIGQKQVGLADRAGDGLGEVPAQPGVSALWIAQEGEVMDSEDSLAPTEGREHKVGRVKEVEGPGEEVSGERHPQPLPEDGSPVRGKRQIAKSKIDGKGTFLFRATSHQKKVFILPIQLS
jgi:hypothetical protein